MTEKEVFELLSNKIEQIFQLKQKTVRVAINGIEGTGKTVFANKFTEYLNQKGKSALHISIDGFHFNREHRYRQGRDSAVGYYEDSYNELAFVEKILVASQNEPPTIITATHDLETDKYLDTAPIEIENNTIIITDGAYLFKPNYRKHWDIKIYLKTDFQTASMRGIKRDVELLGGLKEAIDKYNNRYHKASKIYIQKNQPEELADIIIDNTNFRDLVIQK